MTNRPYLIQAARAGANTSSLALTSGGGKSPVVQLTPSYQSGDKLQLLVERIEAFRKQPAVRRPTSMRGNLAADIPILAKL